MSPRFICAAIGLAFSLSWSSSSQADTSALSLNKALAQLPDAGAAFLSTARGASEGSTSLLVRVSSERDARHLGLIPLTSHLALAWSAPSSWEKLAADPRVHGLRFSPPRRPLMDLAGPTLQVPQVQQDYGLMGEGTIIGIVDTGVDATHSSFRNQDGTTRLSWLLTFEQEPRGVHAALEEAYGCNGDDPCAVYSREDINEILAGANPERLPSDIIGHGSHVASLAAGSNSEYGGVAPLADLVVAAAADKSGGVTDGRILLGTRFVFDRAEFESKPAVVNVSLGSNFGAHDGTSAIEEGLAELGSGEGRAIVTAAGNDGSFANLNSSDYPEPFGIHTEVAVPEDSVIRIPLITSANLSSLSEGAIFVWLSTRPGDDISIAFNNGRGGESDTVPPGQSLAFNSAGLNDVDNYDVVLLNGVDEDLGTEVLPGSAVFAIVGAFRGGRVFEVVLSGSGTARLWLSASGAAGPAGGSFGPLFPRARLPGTIAVPASERRLISVGATTNRTIWTDYQGNTVGFPHEDEGRASFSSAGPNQLGDLKPEIVAPGGGVIGAMSAAADPRGKLNPFSIFSSSGTCPNTDECYVINDEHGISSGTSMAAPMAAGTVALLMQRDPALTMQEAKHLLMAGSKEIPADGPGTVVGVGEIDIVGALLAQERSLSDSSPPFDEKFSRVVWADTFIRPSTESPLLGYLLVHDREDFVTNDGIEMLKVAVEGPGHAEWRQIGTGLVEIKVNADPGSGAQELEVAVSIDGMIVERDTFPIALDPILASHGFELAGGSCTTTPRHKGSPLPLFLLSVSVFLYWNRRRVLKAKH